MEIIKLKPVEATGEILSFLEKRSLIRTCKATPRILRHRKEGCLVEKIYETSPKFGTHKLICVGMNSLEIRLNSHPDNEEFIVINTDAHKFKPLYLIIGLHKQEVLENKAKNKKLSAKDFLALRLKYNDPETSVFTMLKNTAHCEITLAGSKIPPVFFVTEPSKITMRCIDTHHYRLELYSAAKR